MGVIGQQQEEEQKNALPVAQMRAQLAGQKFQMGQQAKAMEGLQAMTGGVPQMITAADLPTIAKTLNLEIDDPKLTQLVGQPKAPFMTGPGQSVIGATAQPTFSKEEVNQALIASAGDPSGAMKMLFERGTKWNEPGTMQKDITYATSPNTPEFARQLAIQKLTIDAQRLGIDVEKFFAETGVRLGGITTPGRSAPTAGGAAPVTGGAPSGAPSRESVQIPAVFGPDINATVTTNFRAGHYGVDFAVPSGTPMAAPLDSTVIATGNNPRSGNYVTLKDSEGNLHTVAHLSEILVKKGQEVPMGSNFGLVGATGNATGPHAHWEIKNGEGKAVDPLKYFGISGGAPAAAGTPAVTTTSSAGVPMVASGYQYPDGTEIKIPDKWPGAKVSDYIAERLKEFQQDVTAANAKTAEAYKEELGSVAGIKPTILFKQNEDFATAQAILKDPQVAPVLGQMYKQGFVPGVMTLLQNGVKFGNYSASVPVYEAWLNKQSPYVQEQLNKLDKVLSGAYLAAMAARPFGAAPSNFEDIKSQNAMATARDPARIISEFMAEQKIANNHLIDVRERFDNFNATKANNIQPHGFFGSAGYKEAKELYKKDYKAYKILGAP
jgi:murein DD-endopeptidase MepM/ murein hydrolase activator NlpD